MKASEIRQSFLDFFTARDHRVVQSAPVIPQEDPSLLFTNAGMNQFKDVFLGVGKRDYLRAVDTQKCIRVSGKHNDLEEVGRDTYHHTFFEMLGNWSFGDYYKKEAIAWAWELLTVTWGLEKRRLYATVFETDNEAAHLWRSETDIRPDHILRFGKRDNFWEMGDTGPCGPCSEIHIDLTPDLSGGSLVNAGDPRVMEIWNLVFIQNNRTIDGTLETLPAKHVDTGMGFERVCAVLQGKQSNYDTDLFTPIIETIISLTRKPYVGESNQVAMRVIADHIRLLTFAIADGAIPSNDGRGYVVRRILRRAARFGRSLGSRDPFIHKITQTVVQTMGTVFPEIISRQSHIERIIQSEEESFNSTLDRGLEIFESVVDRIGHSSQFPGEDAFKLYDTYGFPLDLTQLMAEERKLNVDIAGFTELMEKQKDRSRAGSPSATGLPAAGRLFQSETTSNFIGYSTLQDDTKILAAEGNFVVLDNTPFYAESGGQVGDTGSITDEQMRYRVLDTKKGRGGNICVLDQSAESLVGRTVRASVDLDRRTDVQRNHSATHLVHEALRRVLGVHVHQQGSLVAADHLRFDFPHFGKISPEELRDIEEMVNGKVSENINVFAEIDLPIEKARKIPGVKMFFGEKYGDVVRVVFIDEQFSVEFCGGTHVAQTQDIGLFKIISEGSIASGVRRIEAVTGRGIQRYIQEQLDSATKLHGQMEHLVEETERLERRFKLHDPSYTESPRESIRVPSLQKGATASETLRRIALSQEEIGAAMERLARTSATLQKELRRRNVLEASAGIDELVSSATSLNGSKLVSSRIAASSMDELKSMGDSLRAKLGSGVGVLASVIDQKVALVCVVTDDLIKARNLQAGKIVGEMARCVGGGGGGKPHLATAGGKEVDKLDEALKKASSIVRSMLH